MFIKTIGTKLQNNRGFTLVELLLSIVIAGAIFGLAAETLIQQAETYSFITGRKTTVNDLRHAMNTMSYELMRIEEGDITEIADNSISFTNSNGELTSYNLNSYEGTMAVYAGADVLVPNVENFTIEYQDGEGTVLEAAPDAVDDVKRIKLTITTEPVGNEESMTVSTTIIPRDFLGYSNYQ